MKVVLQRVKQAEVKINNQLIAHIDKGLLCFIGIHINDNEKKCAELAKKIYNLRIFEDDAGKMNLALSQVTGEILVVSQFTLYANTQNGNRPSFSEAMDSKNAKILYEKFINELKTYGCKTVSGQFGSKMEVSLINDGPVTIIMEV